MADEIDLLDTSTRLGPQAPPKPPEVGYAGDNERDLLAGSTKLGPKPKITETSFKDNRSGSVWDEITHGLGLGTRNVIEGVTGLPGAVADVATWPGRLIARGAGLPQTAPSDMISKTLDATGLPTPQTEGEKLRAEMVRGGAAMISPMGIGTAAPQMVARLPAAVRPLVASNPASLPGAVGQVVAGGTGGAVGEFLATDARIPDELKPAARMIGNVLGAGGASAVTHAAGTLKNAIKGIPTELGAALQRLGIVPKTMGSVSERPGVASLEGMLTKAPLAGDVLRPAQRQTVDQFGNAVERQAAELNLQADTPKATGAIVQDELRNWRSTVWPEENRVVWEPLNQRMAGAAVDPAPYRRALERAAKPPDLNTLPNSQEAFASAQARKWLDALNADAPPGQMLSWEQAHALKTRIGDAMGTPEIVAGLGNKSLQGIYGGLAEGMENAATQHGQAALFKAANRVTTEGHQFIDGTLSKGISAPNKLQESIAPDAAANAMIGDNEALLQLRQRVPKAADAMAAWNLRQSSQAKGSQQGAGDTTSSGTFLTNLRNEQVRRPEGMRALYGDTPKTAQGLDDLLRVAERMREVQHNVNTSGSAGTGQLLSLPFQLGAAWYGGGWPAALGTAALNAAPYTAAKVLTNPMAIRLAGTRPGPRLPLSGMQAGVLGDIPSITVRPEPEDRRR